METFFHTLLEFTDSLGYFGVFLLMTVESSFIPFPSELVIPPAAYLAYQGGMNIFLVILFGVLGSLSGALVNYFLAMWLGRPVVYALTEKKYAKLFLISSKKVEKAEKYFLEYGGISTFLGRLIPAIRQLISIPAGFTRMRLKSFLFYTTLGSGLWVTILAILGYFFGARQDLVKQYSTEIGLIFLFFVVVVTFGFYFRKRRIGR